MSSEGQAQEMLIPDPTQVPTHPAWEVFRPAAHKQIIRAKNISLERMNLSPFSSFL
ncbi:Uncharacterized protein dnm_060110 [Desulfonema magnum]|uniref:Uncharacterized protein n=1 Tax=Desulfonema magnum TaxID=45655 RepID=A0A975GQK0_9BACT|nr:Uncharacterized protein dnm_060110 [Desulfonema magnum]